MKPPHCCTRNAKSQAKPIVELVNLSLKWPHLNLTLSMFTTSILTFMSRNVGGGCLIMNKLSTCIHIMHSCSSFYCMPHTFHSLFICKVLFPLRSFVSFEEDKMLQDPTIFFLATFICQSSSLGSRIFSFTSFMHSLLML